MSSVNEVLYKKITKTTQKALTNLSRTQNELGSWSGDYGGPMFLLPMYVALCRIADKPIPTDQAARMKQYLFNVQNEDGSIGLHCEGAGCMFTSCLVYTALTLLGVSRNDERMVILRQWIQRNGTALSAASWGKFTLALLNIYDYDGLHSLMPEMWLLPYRVPIHPGRFWCHCRQVYMPMAFLYGLRARIEPDALIRQLREDLYDRPYKRIDFSKYRDTIAPMDNYSPATPLQRVANRAMDTFEKRHSTRLRHRALAELAKHIDYEDSVTTDIDIGPVNAVLNTVCHHFREPGGAAFQRGFAQLQQYLWDGHDGLKMQGYNNSQLWDTAFTIQSYMATPWWKDHADAMVQAHGFIRDNQILEDVPNHEKFYRHPCRGGWPFSNRDHGWPITDCTAEGFKCAVALEHWVEQPVPVELLKDAVRLMLSWQNDDGGWATYERQRGGAWIEQLNPSGVFGDIMVDYSYTECTSASLQALINAKNRFPGFLTAPIETAIDRGVAFIRNKQRADGSWEGSWGVCFTYGTWFGISGLIACGVPTTDPCIQRACAFLLKHQKEDGGWGEHHTSCSERRYVQHPDSQVVMTSWALLGLIRGGCRDEAAIERGLTILTRKQQKDGSWEREAIAGVFNRTCMITYDNYRNYFPVWAMGEWLSTQNS